MIKITNFEVKTIQETNGFKRKINKVSKQLGIKEIIYSEIVNISEDSLEVLIIDSSMIFHKVELYTEKATNMLNNGISQILSTCSEISLDDITSEKNSDLIEAIKSELSKSMELLNIENSGQLDKMDSVTSSKFNVTILNFTYPEVYNAIKALVEKKVPFLYNFKIIDISNNSVEVLAITTECKIYQFILKFDLAYSRFFNRYISSVIPHELFIEMKRNLRNEDFSKSLNHVSDSNHNAVSFLQFILEKCLSKSYEKGFKGEGLKNVYEFFLATSKDEKDAKERIRKYFISVPTYLQKKI